MDRSISLLYHDLALPGHPTSSGFQGADADLYKLDESLFRDHLDGIARCRTQPDHRLFTFDDGGDSAGYIGSLLSQRGWHGYFFVATDFIGTTGFMDPADVQALARDGHTIGSHSCSHPLRMAALSRERLLQEWKSSRAILEDLLGRSITAASIPGGYYSRVVAEAAADAGFEELFTSEPVARPWRIGPMRVFGRFSVQRTTTAAQVAALVQGDALPRLQQWTYWNMKKGLKRAGGRYWIDFRKAYLSRRVA